MVRNQFYPQNRMLMADDSDADREIFRRIIAESEIPCDFSTVEDGQTLMQCLTGVAPYEDRSRYPTPHLLLLDIHMPKMDGKAVLKAIRTLPDLKRLPVVVLTTSSQDRDINECYELGANAYIVKPIGRAQFRSTIQFLESFWLNLVKLPKLSEPSDA